MTVVNVSVDFEMGWGDLGRLARDAEFRRRVEGGREQCYAIVETLRRAGIPSTWGIVGACCFDRIDELAAIGPSAFATVQPRLADVRARADHRALLFAPDLVAAIAASELIEVGSHGFMHLVPDGVPIEILHEDVAASVSVLERAVGRPIRSFIPPQNYHWPDAAFSGTSVTRVRHTPRVWGIPYSAPRRAAKVARLWNDFARPATHRDASGTRAQLVFLRTDRGPAAWRTQLRMLRRRLARNAGALACYTHPHNLYSPVHLQRFAELCDVIAEARARQTVSFGPFVRVVH